jgi:hypothetical protein
MGKICTIRILFILLTVSTLFCPAYVEATGEMTSDGRVDGYHHTAIRFFTDAGNQYNGWFRAESNPVDFFIICADNLEDNWTYSTDDIYEEQSGMQGEFSFVIPYSGEWMFCCYNPNSESQNVIIYATYYTSGDYLQFGIQVVLAALIIVGISLGGWRYKMKQRRIEREADVFSSVRVLYHKN